ncbi:MAG TPA: NYN domain-containing protein [Jatrophihabitans sp.]|nr:NYN domain-containing protein [Jatrophihabitans sp.]
MADSALERPLPAAARQQLVAIAAEVMSRTPVAELPAGLRRFARFAPSKRLRLGASEIAAALAVDEPFRAAVAQVVLDTSPELAEQVRAGKPPETADPVDVAVIAYLIRPDGWAELLAGIADRLEGAEARRGAEAELSRLQTELARLTELNQSLLADREHARSTGRAAAAGQAEELAELRRRLRTAQALVRAAGRTAEQSAAELERLRADRDARHAADAAELRRLRARLADLEAELEVGRRAVRAAREHDNARLWLLLETLGGALAGLRAELAVTDPGIRPADLVESETVAVASRPSTVDGPLLDRLLETGPVHLIVDGYNLTKTGYGSLTLADQRSRLIGTLGPLAARTGAEVTVAFDGTAAPLGTAAVLPTPRGVRVLFSANGQLADDLIRQLLRAEPAGRPVLVASSDAEVAAAARAAAAWPVPATVLLSRLER